MSNSALTKLLQGRIAEKKTEEAALSTSQSAKSSSPTTDSGGKVSETQEEIQKESQRNLVTAASSHQVEQMDHQHQSLSSNTSPSTPSKPTTSSGNTSSPQNGFVKSTVGQFQVGMSQPVAPPKSPSKLSMRPSPSPLSSTFPHHNVANNSPKPTTSENPSTKVYNNPRLEISSSSPTSPRSNPNSPSQSISPRSVLNTALLNESRRKSESSDSETDPSFTVNMLPKQAQTQAGPQKALPKSSFVSPRKVFTNSSTGPILPSQKSAHVPLIPELGEQSPISSPMSSPSHVGRNRVHESPSAESDTDHDEDYTGGRSRSASGFTADIESEEDSRGLISGPSSPGSRSLSMDTSLFTNSSEYRKASRMSVSSVSSETSDSGFIITHKSSNPSPSFSRDSSRDFGKENPQGAPLRIFAFCPESGKSCAITIMSHWTWNTFLQHASEKLLTFARIVQYRSNGVELTSFVDLRENDEVTISSGIPLGTQLATVPPSIVDVPQKRVKGRPKGMVPTSPRVPKLGKPSKNDNSKVSGPLSPTSAMNPGSLPGSARSTGHSRMSSLIKKKIYAAPLTGTIRRRKVERSESTSDVSIPQTQTKRSILVSAAQRLFKIEEDTTLGRSYVRYYEFALSKLPGTNVTRRSSFVDDEQMITELKRSKSLPDLSHFSLLPRLSHVPNSRKRSSTIYGPLPSSDKDSQSSTEDETSDVEQAPKSAKHIFDLVDAITNEEVNPLTLPEADVHKRMMEEEKQDMENIEEDDGDVTAGTLRALVRRLTSHLQSDEYLSSFLLTYDLFMDHTSLLRALIMLFRAPVSDEQAATMGSSGTVPLTLTPSTSASSAAILSPSSKRVAESSPMLFRPGEGPKFVLPPISGSATPPPVQSNSSGQLAPSIGSARRGYSSSVNSLNLTSAKIVKDSIAANPSKSSADGIFTPRQASMADRMRLVIQFRIINVMKRWLVLRYDVLRLRKDFMELLSSFIQYLQSSPVEKHQSGATTLSNTLKEVKKDRHNLHRKLDSAKPLPLQLISLSGASRYKSILDIPALDLAQQITIGEQDIYGRIALSEYRYFSAKDREKKAPHLTKIVERFNKVSYWIATTIVLALGSLNSSVGKSAKHRAAIISHFIAVMDELKRLQNFNGVMQVFSALNMTAITRMEKSWSYVSPRCKAILEDVHKLFSSNYKEYREMLDLMIEPPCIPLQEVVMRDLTFIEENPTVLENGWINFQKMLMLGKAYRALKKFQSSQYDFRSNDYIEAFINSQVILGEDDLFNQSRRVEPPKSATKKGAGLVPGSPSTHRSSPGTLSDSGQKSRDVSPTSSSGNISKASKPSDSPQKPHAKDKDKKSKVDKKVKAPAVKKKLDWSEVSVASILTYPEFYAQFKAYLSGMYADEALGFYVEVNEYKKFDFNDKSSANQNKIKAFAKGLYDTYVSDEGTKALSLDSQYCKVQVSKSLQGSEPMVPALFDSVLDSIIGQLRSQIIEFKNKFSGE